MSGRVSLTVAGVAYDSWTSVEVVRDLGEIAGSFRLDAVEQVRAERAGGGPAWRHLLELRPGQAVDLAIDGEMVLRGWLTDVELEWGPDTLSAQVSGYDRTGDLVDCAAAPDGPAEYRGLTLLEIARRLCAPFGIAVRADVDVGEPFGRFAIDVAETAMSAIEKAARQRAVLVVSDGVGGLLLTRSGIRRAPGPLFVGDVPAGGIGGITRAGARFSWRQRFREYIYKSQQEGDGRSRNGGPPRNHDANPMEAPLPPVPGAQPEARGILRAGRAIDSEVTRHRPRVRLVRTENAGASVQEQADWLMRTARSASEQLSYIVHDWRAGPDRRLWRPNERAAVLDRHAGIDRDMLVSGVVYRYGEAGSTTELRVTGPEAFDRIREDERRRRRQHEGGPAVRDNAARGIDGRAR